MSVAWVVPCTVVVSWALTVPIEAVLLMSVPLLVPAFTWTWSERFTVWPAAMEPTVHVTVLPFRTAPDAERKVTLLGSVSVTTTFVPATAEVLVTPIV